MARPIGFLALTLVVVALTQAAGAVHQDSQPKSKDFAKLLEATEQPLDLNGAKAVVLFFLLADCPNCNYYATEISAIAKDFAKAPVRCYAVHTDPDTTAQKAVKHAKEFKLTCNILLDPKHQLVKLAGAKVTPEAVVLLPDGKIAFRGRIDDTFLEFGRGRRAEPNKRDLREAMTAVLKGEKYPEPWGTAIGCFIPDMP